jgi:hypothetical protein
MIRSPHKSTGSDHHGRRVIQPQALVVVVRNGLARDADAVNSLTLRNQVSPLADWLEVDIGGTSLARWESRLRQELSAALGRKHMDFSQLVLMGWRDAARAALDLILKGAITCAGIVAVDVPCTLPSAPIAATAASIRIIRHDDGSQQGAGLIDSLRRHDADIRLMNLPAGGRHARDVTTRATAAFLSELTAKACLQSSASKGASHV